MPICRLCQKEGNLKKSHAIPNTVFKKILRAGSGKGVYLPGGCSKPVHLSSDSWDIPQLCGNCEALLNQCYEDYSMKVLRGILGCFNKHAAGVTFSDIKISKLINFYMAVFWRAANSSHSAYSKVIIPEPWNRQIGELLLSNTTVPLKLATVKLSRLIDYTKTDGFTQITLRSMIMSPFLRKVGSRRYSFCFVFEGFFVEIFMPGLKISDRKKPGVLNNSLEVIMIPFLNIFDVPEIKEAFILGYKKSLDGDVTFEG